jgi:hypothetical protein
MAPIKRQIDIDIVYKAINTRKVQQDAERIHKSIQKSTSDMAMGLSTGIDIPKELRDYAQRGIRPTKDPAMPKGKAHTSEQELAYARALDQASQLQTLSKKMKVYPDAVISALSSSGMAVNKHGNVIDVASKKALGWADSMSLLVARNKSFAQVLTLPTDAVIALNRQGYYFTSGFGARMAQWVRYMTQGLHRFKMEFLSIMFFGMQMQMWGNTLLGPAMEALGIGELISQVLTVVMLPALLEIYPILLDLVTQFLELDEASKMLIGKGAIFLLLAGTVLLFVGQVGLGVGGLIEMASTLKIVGLAMHGFAARVLSGAVALFAFSSKGILTATVMTRLKSGITAIGLGFKSLISAVFSPLMLKIALVALAVYALYWVWKNNFLGIQGVVSTVIKAIAWNFTHISIPIFKALGTVIIFLYHTAKHYIHGLADVCTIGFSQITIWIMKAKNAFLSFAETISGKDFSHLKSIDTLEAMEKKMFEANKRVALLQDVGFKVVTLETQRDVDRWGGALDKVSESLNKFADNMGEVSEESTSSRTELYEYVAANGELKEASLESTKAVAGMADQTQNTANTMSAILPKVLNLDSAYGNMSGTANGLEDSLGGLIGTFEESIGVYDLTDDSLAELTKRYASLTAQIEKSHKTLNAFNSSYSSSIKPAQNISYTSSITQRSYASAADRALDEQNFLLKSTQLPRLAKGGIVYRPTLAVIGESGPEAVVPLSGGGGRASNSITINMPLEIHTHDSPRDIEFIIDRKLRDVALDIRNMVK